MKYKKPRRIERKKAEAAFQSEDVASICDALVGVAYYDSDWRWVQGHCLRFLRHPNIEIRGLAATCLGHLARIHGKLDLDTVKPALLRLTKDPQVGGRAEDALDDIKMHLGRDSSSIR